MLETENVRLRRPFASFAVPVNKGGCVLGMALCGVIQDWLVAKSAFDDARVFLSNLSRS